MQAHQRAERNQNCPSWSNDWPRLLIHLRDGHWALTLQWPCFLGPSLCQADSQVGRKSGGLQWMFYFALIFDVFEKSFLSPE